MTISLRVVDTTQTKWYNVGEMMVERQANPAARQSLREQAKRPAWRRYVAGKRDAEVGCKVM